MPTAVVEQLQRGFATGDTAALVTGLQSELRADPGSVKTWGSLGLAYEQRARETGDSTYYGKAEGALRRALSLRRTTSSQPRASDSSPCLATASPRRSGWASAPARSHRRPPASTE